MNGTTSDSDTDVKAEDKSGESEEAPKSEPVKIPILKTEDQNSSETVPQNKEDPAPAGRVTNAFFVYSNFAFLVASRKFEDASTVTYIVKNMEY